MFIFSGKVTAGSCILVARTGSIISTKKIVVTCTQGVNCTFPAQTVFVHAETNKTIRHNAKRTYVMEFLLYIQGIHVFAMHLLRFVCYR
jgi:hypothetical protein